MRFRAKAGSEQFQFLADVVQHVHRLSATMLLKLGPSAIHLACNENQSGTGDGLPLFAKLSPADLFFEYRLEARANNHILMSLKPAHLLRAARALREFSLSFVVFLMNRLEGCNPPSLPRVCSGNPSSFPCSFVSFGSF